MKKPLDGKAVGIILGVVGVLVVVAGFLYFKPEIGPSKPVVPEPYVRPGSSGYGPNSGSQEPNQPIGAPAAPAGSGM